MEFWKDFGSIKELIKMVSDAKVDFTWEKEDGCKISINAGVTSVVPVAAPQVVPAQTSVAHSVDFTPITSHSEESAPAEEAVKTYSDEDVQIVTSPLVGTFYSAASPDDAPFVKVGDKVTKGQKLGIIEAMKLMNDIESEYDGEIVEIMVTNECMVEYGQPMFKIK